MAGKGQKYCCCGWWRGKPILYLREIYINCILTNATSQVAAGRILHALNADAKVTVICPASGLNDEVAFRLSEGQIAHKDKNFEPADLDGADMVLCAIDDPEASSNIWKLCKEKRIPANIADVPPECDFYFGSVYRDGPLQVMVSTNGNGPKLASIVRKKVADAIPDNMGTAIDNVGKLRKKLREVAPNADEGPKRMKWYVCLYPAQRNLESDLMPKDVRRM